MNDPTNQFETPLSMQEGISALLSNARQGICERYQKCENHIRMFIHDDGIGFDTAHPLPRKKGKVGLGLLSMRERAISSGGTLKVKSARSDGSSKSGTTVQVRIPLVRGSARQLQRRSGL